MGKKFRGKICAYCAMSPSTTEDHVFAREFFLLEDRHNLPKAPACRQCNERKSRLEHYLISVLPFGGRHAQAVTNLQRGVPRRLAKNRKLHKELTHTMEPAWLREGAGLFRQTSTVSFDGEQLEELLKHIARGLTWHHRKTYMGPEYYASVLFLPDTLSGAFHLQVRHWNAAGRVINDIGRGTVQYEGVQATDPSELTVWRISMYGGVPLSSESGTGTQAEASCHWWVITGPPELAALIDGLK